MYFNFKSYFIKIIIILYPRKETFDNKCSIRAWGKFAWTSFTFYDFL